MVEVEIKWSGWASSLHTVLIFLLDDSSVKAKRKGKGSREGILKTFGGTL
jgi:hypothetical protein